METHGDRRRPPVLQRARNILYYMQNEAMRLMISRGHGLQALEEPVRRALAERKKA